MITARNRQKTETEGKGRTDQETIITTGTGDRIKDRTRDGITTTDDRNARKDKNVRRIWNVRKIRKDRNVRKVRSVVPDRKNLKEEKDRKDRKEIRIRRNRRIIMKSLLRNSLFCLFAACLAACNDENTVYHSYQSLPNEGWGKSDTLSFLIPVSDSIPTTFRLFAEVRNRTDYPYHDLHLFISQNMPDSTVWRTDTIAISLADSTGRWTGKGWGSVYQAETFVKSVRPLHPGNYTCLLYTSPSPLD